MSRRKKPIDLAEIAEYIVTARRLAKKFPSLKRLTRRKTLKPFEKGMITRANNINAEMNKTVSERDERYIGYKFPADRVRTNKQYADIVRQLKRFDPYFQTPNGKRLIRKRSFTPAERSLISRKHNELPFTEQLFPVTKEMLKHIPEEAIYGAEKGGPKAIKLLNTSGKTTIKWNKKEGALIVNSGGYKWFHYPTGPDHDTLAETAQRAFNEGAEQVHFWTSHGRVATAAGDMTDFLIMLRNDYMLYVAETIESGQDENWMIGIAALYE